MPQQKKWSKLVSSFMVFSLLAGLPAVGAPSAHADAAVSTTKFSDVPAGHWAEKHIAKLASQGIIKGTNGAFKPNDNITQQEAVALAIRFIGKESQVKADDAIVFPQNFDVSSYFKPYIILAFEEKLLDRDAEFKLADAEPGTAWGTKKASREWITKLIVKAIGKEQTAASLAAAPIAFKDGSKVGAAYTGYVNAAVSLQLINGVTADTFDPKGSITRAAIATMLSRAEPQYPVNYSGQFTAILTSKDNSSLHLYQGDKDTAVDLSADTYLYRFDSDKKTTLDQLVPNTKLLVVANGSKALYVEQLDDTLQVEKIAGTVDHVLPNNKLLLFVGDKSIEVTYDSKTTVTDGSGTVIPVNTLAQNSKVEITRDSYRTVPVAISINVQSAPVNKTGQGSVKSVQATPPALTVLDGATGATLLYNVSPQVDVVWQGQILDGGLSQLRVGDVVSYEVKDSLVTKVTITQTSAKLVRGEFYSATPDGRTMQYTLPNQPTNLIGKFVTDNVDVSIDGLSGTNIFDLIKGDVLDITLNDKDQVAAIKVVNRKVTVLAGATVVSYDNDLKALTVKDANNNLASVYLSDKTRLDMNGNPLQLNSISTFLLKGKKITLGYTDSKAVFIQFVYKYTGTLTSINTNTNQITLLQSTGVAVTVPLDLPYYVEIAGKTSAVLSDVKTGDTITALLNANQDKILNVQVHTAKQAEVYAVDSAAKKLKLKTSDGVFYDYSTAVLDVTNEKGDKLAISNIAAGQLGNLYFVGASVASFKVVNVTVGRIVSVATNKVTVADYNGNTVDIALSAGYSVVKNGVAGSTAAVLAAGDRVETKLDEKDRLVITVLNGIAKSFWKYDSASRVLSTKRASLTDTYTYTVTSATKVSQNGSPIAISQLSEGDSIILYFYRDTLVEIAKG